MMASESPAQSASPTLRAKAHNRTWRGSPGGESNDFLNGHVGKICERGRRLPQIRLPTVFIVSSSPVGILLGDLLSTPEKARLSPISAKLSEGWCRNVIDRIPSPEGEKLESEGRRENFRSYAPSFEWIPTRSRLWLPWLQTLKEPDSCGGRLWVTLRQVRRTDDEAYCRLSTLPSHVYSGSNGSPQ
jgi:hypothetical protein